MSPEEWLASRKKSESSSEPDSEVKVMSPEEFMASRKEEPSQPQTKYMDIAGLTKPEISEGGAAFLAPTSKRKEVPISQQTFGQDPSRVGSVPLKEYGSNIAKSAGMGAAIGGTVGLFSGPGALITATGGAVMGGLSGLAESVAKDLGYGSGVQTLAGLSAGMPAPVKGTVDFITKSKLANAVFSKAEDIALGMIPKYGTVRKIASAFPKSEPKLAGKDVEAALGVEPKTAGVKIATDPTSETYKFRQQLQSEHGEGTSVSGLYEKAKAGYDEALSKATPDTLKNEFEKIGKQLPKASRESSMDAIRKVFVNDNGNAYSGEKVIENLKSPEFKSLTKSEKDVVYKALNDFIPNRGEEVARKAAEKEFVANARDSLPELFKSKEYKTINNQMGNFGKDEVGQKVFKQELGYYLKGLPVEQGKTLWNNIGETVNKNIIKDPIEFRKVTQMINDAKTPQELSRAANLIIKATYGAYESKRKKK
jgi:hypothetical protein